MMVKLSYEIIIQRIKMNDIELVSINRIRQFKILLHTFRVKRSFKEGIYSFKTGNFFQVDLKKHIKI